MEYQQTDCRLCELQPSKMDMASIADRLKSIKSTVNPSFGHSSEEFESVPGCPRTLRLV